MTHDVRIAPSILAADFTRLGDQVVEAEQAGADRIHIDVMDGRFVPNITMGPMIVQAVRQVTALPLDVHLMIVEPDHLLEAFAESGATYISVHVEATPNLHRTLDYIRSLGCRPGVAINPATPAFMLSEVLHMIDVILVMTVNPGFGGQEFLPETLPKIRQLRMMCEAAGRQIDLVADGGINEETIMEAGTAGANVMVVGSACFNPQWSVSNALDRLRRRLQNEKPD